MKPKIENSIASQSRLFKSKRIDTYIINVSVGVVLPSLNIIEIYIGLFRHSIVSV